MNAYAWLLDTQPEPARVIALSDGAPNRFSGAWPDRSLAAVSRAELHEFRAFPGAGPCRGRALVYAGGGYLQLVHDKEGVQLARWLNSLGLDAYVLVHRLPGQDDGLGGVWPMDIALQDGLAALDWLAGQPDAAARPLLHVGLSSGGHLAGVMACQHHPLQARGVLIAYAPVNANHRDHKVPAGKPDFLPPQKQAFYDAWPIGLARYPHGLPRMPVFLAYALHDPVVPVAHALRLIEGVQASGGMVDAHLFPQAPHGFALRELAGSHKQWPALAQRWISERLEG
jgi:acetyl esterase/lipase